MGGEGQRSPVLWDPELMRRVLSEHLRWADGSQVDVRSCAVTYVHDTPGRCLLHYNIVVRDRHTGADREELVTGFVSGGDRAEQVAQQIRPAAPRPSPGCLVAVGSVPDLDLVLQVFPFDQRLPALHRLMTGSAPVVAAAVTADLGPGEWRISGWQAESLRYRVDQRAMVRLTVTAHDHALGASQERRVYAKVFREGADGARAFEVQRALWQRAAGRPEAFAVARPIAYVAAAQTLLTSEVVGTNLWEVFAHSTTPSLAVRRTARALADLHQISPAEVDFAARRRSPRDELVRLDKIINALRASALSVGVEVDRVAWAITEAMAEPPLGMTHFDLKPAHILVAPSGVALLDFDKLALADPLVDVANFLVFLGKERSGRSSDGGERDHVHHFVDEYFAHVPELWRIAFPARYVLALLSEAARNGRGNRGRAEQSDRATVVASLIRQAQLALEGRFQA